MLLYKKLLLMTFGTTYVIILLHTHTLLSQNRFFSITEITDAVARCPYFFSLLSQTSSDIRFGDRKPALLCIDIADFWPRKEHLARLIISQLEQTVTLWDATYHFSWLIARLFTHQSVYSYISNAVGIIIPVEFAKSISYGKIVTSAWEGSQ